MSHISIRDARKSYGKDEVIHGVNLEIETGEFVVILGPSGCGKSTLLRMIAGLEDITAGEIAIADKVVNDLEPRERGCAMVFQNYALYPHMTVADNIGYALKVAGMPKAERAEKVRKVASSVGLEEFLDRRPGALSGGQRQRVAMARAIIREPEVFLFDEPLSNLDAKLRVQMRHEIRRIHNRVKATSVFVTHDQHEGMTLADRMVIMNQGTIDQVGTPEEVYNAPATTYVAGFIGSPAMNFLGGQVSASHGAVVLEDGSILPIPAQAARSMDGKLVQIGARPEALSLCQPGTGSLTAAFEFYEELGSEGLHHLKIEDVPFSVLSETKMRLVEGTEADLIALQEVETHVVRSGMVHQAEEIAARLPGMHWVYGPGIDLDAATPEAPGRRRQFGNMVLSRWPILSVVNHTLPKIALHGIFHLQRTLVECVIDAPGGALRFCSVHLDHVSTDTRMGQVDYMLEVLLRGHERGASAGGVMNDPTWLDRPLPPQPMTAIVMGDMNFTPDSPEYTRVVGDVSGWHGRTLRAHGLADAWTLAGNDEAAGDTIPRDGRAPRRIDHCFVTTDLADRVTAMEIGEDAVGSDHQPVFVTLAP